MLLFIHFERARLLSQKSYPDFRFQRVDPFPLAPSIWGQFFPLATKKPSEWAKTALNSRSKRFEMDNPFSCGPQFFRPKVPRRKCTPHAGHSIQFTSQIMITGWTQVGSRQTLSASKTEERAVWPWRNDFSSSLFLSLSITLLSDAVFCHSFVRFLSSFLCHPPVFPLD